MNNSKNVRVFKLLSLLIPSFMLCNQLFPMDPAVMHTTEAPDLFKLESPNPAWDNIKKESITEVLSAVNLANPFSRMVTLRRLVGEDGGWITALYVISASGGLSNLIQISLYWLYGVYCWFSGRENLLVPRNIYSFEYSNSLEYYVKTVKSANEWYDECMGSPLMPLYLAWYYATGIATFVVGLLTFALTLSALQLGAAQLTSHETDIKKALRKPSGGTELLFLSASYDWYLANRHKNWIETFINEAVDKTANVDRALFDLKNLISSSEPDSFYSTIDLQRKRNLETEVKARFGQLGIDLSKLIRILYLNTLIGKNDPKLDTFLEDGNKFGFRVREFQEILERVRVDGNPATNYLSCFWMGEQEDNQGKKDGAKQVVDVIIPGNSITENLNTQVKELIDAVFIRDIKANAGLVQNVKEAYDVIESNPALALEIKEFYEKVVKKMLTKLSKAPAQEEAA